MSKTSFSSLPNPTSLVLGSVQWGLKYGRANTTGKPDLKSVMEILELVSSRTAAPVIIDTARAYGDAESVIGELFKLSPQLKKHFEIITKLSPLANLNPDTDPRSAVNVAAVNMAAVNMAEESLTISRQNLGLAHLPTVLLHRWAHRAMYGGAVWELLLQEVRNNRIGKLGVSVQSVQELKEALAETNVKHIQLPFNVLDGRWHADNSALELIESRSTNDVTFHVRSAFLQGVLLSSPSVWPNVTEVNTVQITQQLDQTVRELGRLDRADLCIAYVRSFPWVGGVVIGMETPKQCEDNLRYFAKSPLTTNERELVRARLNCCDEALLNPALWK